MDLVKSVFAGDAVFIGQPFPTATGKDEIAALYADFPSKLEGPDALTFLGFTIYRARSLSQTVIKTVFQTDGKRFSRARAGMRERLRRMRHQPVEDQIRAINQILRGHFNYYGLAGNAKKLHAFWNFTRREWKHSLSKRSQKGRLTWEDLTALLEKHPMATPRIRISYPQLAAYARLKQRKALNKSFILGVTCSK